MSYEQAITTPLTAYEDDELHLVGTVGPREARQFEMHVQPEQQQQQRQAMGGTARLGMYLDNGPVAFAPFTPHGYHAVGSRNRADRHVL